MSTQVIEVRAFGKQVGALAQDPKLGCTVFEYSPAWVKTQIELAPRTMPLKPAKSHAFPSLPKDTFQGLPGLIADALPDTFGNALIDAWMQSRGIDKRSITVLDRLAYMGRRAMGALEFRPALGERKDRSDALKMNSLVDAARMAVQGDLSSDAMAKAALAQIIRVGTSAGGARAKAVIAWNPQTQELRSGQFEVAEGFEHWMLKFDGVGLDSELGLSRDYGRIEYAYHLMARDCGIEMAPCRLLEENGRAHFMTRRFDREGSEKHHLQTLCAMEHMDYKQRETHAYAQAFMCLSHLGLGQESRDELFRRMAFNVMARNCDDHTKNFAFLLKADGNWALAPAYDITHAFNPKGEWTYQHLMSVNGKFSEITREDLLQEASRFGVRNPKLILEKIRDVLGRFASYAKEAGLGEESTARVQADFRRI